MAKEMLSGLQKHILYLLFEHWSLKVVSIKSVKKMCFVIRNPEYKKAADVVLSRTLWNMQKKGLIKIYGTELDPIIKDLNKKASMIKIDENGIIVASLLRKRKENLNNKEWGNY